jgi:hypothetical protein
MDNVQLIELTQEEMLEVDGGQANGVTCALAGGVLVFTAATGAWPAAIMAGVYLYTNRGECLSL